MNAIQPGHRRRGKTSKTFLRRPCREIGGAEVDEKVPLPVQHGEQVLHAAQVGLQQAGAAPDGHHPPGRGPDVGVLLGDLQDLPVQVGGALSRKGESETERLKRRGRNGAIQTERSKRRGRNGEIETRDRNEGSKRSLPFAERNGGVGVTCGSRR